MEQSQQNQKGQQYFDLMENVGTSGKYQWIVYIFACLTFLNNALVTFNIPMLFANPQFDCSDQSLTFSECQKYVCDNLSQTQIEKFPVIKKIESLATQFGPYRCSGNITLAYYRACFGLGQFVGLFIAMMLADNLSRRKAYLFCIFVSTFGVGVIFIAQNMLMAVIGITIVGVANAPMLRIIQSMISETTERQLCQKYLSSLSGSSSVGALLALVSYSSIGQWRTALFYCAFLPGAFILIFFYLLVEDTPKFILQKTVQQAIQALNRIAKINKKQINLERTDIAQRIQKQHEFRELKQVVTPIDLLRYESLRSTSILITIIFSLCDLIYYFHATVINTIGVNPQFNAVMIACGELCSMPFAVLLIHRFERKRIFWTVFGFGAILSLVTSFVQAPSECDYCQEGILQIALVATTRFFVMFFWSCFYNYLVEFFPVSILNIGIGVPTAFGGLGMAVCQVVLLSAEEDNINIFIIASGFMMLVCFLIIGVPETYEMPIRDQIYEVQKKYQIQIEHNRKQAA